MGRRKGATRRHAESKGLRSGFELLGYAFLQSQTDIEFSYESEELAYTVPTSNHKYTPDFIVTTKSGKKMYIEFKGNLTPADRKKMKLVIEQHPDKDIRILIQRDNYISNKNVATRKRYSDWLKAQGITYHVSSKGELPSNWLKE